MNALQLIDQPHCSALYGAQGWSRQHRVGAMRTAHNRIKEAR